MISLDEHTRVHTVWFLGGGDDIQFDVLGALYKPKDEPWRLVYRFRYYSGTSNPHDGTDRKEWTEVVDDGRGPDAIAKRFGEVLANLRKMLPPSSYVDTLHVNDNGEAAMRAINARPWAHPAATAPGGDA